MGTVGVGRGTVGTGDGMMREEVGRGVVTAGTVGTAAIEEDCEAVGGMVGVTSATPFALVVNVHGTPELSYFLSPIRIWK